MPSEKKISPEAAALLDAYASNAEDVEYTLRGSGNGGSSGGGERKIRARRLSDASLIVAIQEDVEKYSRLLGPGPCPPRLADYKGTRREVISACVFGAHLLIEPKLTLDDLLHIAKHGGQLIFDLTGPAIEALGFQDALDTAAAIESEGNESD
jgi:hypothetical protein